MKKTLEAIKQQPFINMDDLRTILGGESITPSMTKKYYAEIRKKATTDLESQGLIPPKKTIIPAVYVWQYLKPYGITKN